MKARKNLPLSEAVEGSDLQLGQLGQILATDSVVSSAVTNLGYHQSILKPKINAWIMTAIGQLTQN